MSDPSTSPSSSSTPQDRPPNPTQISPLPGLTHHITTHTPTGHATIHSSTPATWTPILKTPPTTPPDMAYNVIYTTSTPTPSLSQNNDIHTHTALLSTHTLGLVNPNGSVARIVDFAPGNTPIMHRTQSLDYGIVLEGEVEMVLEGGVVRRMGRGDVAVQRGTNHAWRCVGGGWARMFFVLQECEEIVVGGRVLGEDLSAAGDAGAGH